MHCQSTNSRAVVCTQSLKKEAKPSALTSEGSRGTDIASVSAPSFFILLVTVDSHGSHGRQGPEGKRGAGEMESLKSCEFGQDREEVDKSRNSIDITDFRVELPISSLMVAA